MPDKPDLSPAELRLEHAVFGGPELPALVLLHAGGMTREEWTPFLEGWTPHFRLLAPTALGHGGSPTPASPTLDSMADSVLRLLDDLGVARAHFLGSSMGGATALRIALRYPGRVDRLILYRSGYRAGPSMRRALERMATPETWRRWGLERWMARQHAPQGGPEAWRRVIRRVAEIFSQPAVSLGLADLARIESPTLLIGGDRDDLVPLEDLVEMYRALPSAALWVVPGAGHLMGMEGWRRAAFQEEVRRFLTR